MPSLFVFLVLLLVVIGWEGLAMAMAKPGENISCHANTTPMTHFEVGPNYISFCSKPLEPSEYSDGHTPGSSAYWLGSPDRRSALDVNLQYRPFQREAMCSITVQCFPLISLSHSSSLSPSSLPKEQDCWSSSSFWVAWRSPCIKLPDYSQCVIELASDGDFRIRSDRGVEWSSGTEGKGATQIRVNNGCFIELLDSHNVTVWKSSDAPSSPQCSHSFPSFTFHGLPPLLLLLALGTFLSLP